jgi:hypothetical protein
LLNALAWGAEDLIFDFPLGAALTARTGLDAGADLITVVSLVTGADLARGRDLARGTDLATGAGLEGRAGVFTTGARDGLVAGFFTALLALAGLALVGLEVFFAGAGFLVAFLATFAPRSFQARTIPSGGFVNPPEAGIES